MAKRELFCLKSHAWRWSWLWLHGSPRGYVGLFSAAPLEASKRSRQNFVDPNEQSSANSTTLALPSRILHSSLATGTGRHGGPTSANKLLLRRAFGLRQGLVRNLAETNRWRKFLPGQTRPAASNRLGGRSYAPPQRPTERGCSAQCSVLREAGV